MAFPRPRLPRLSEIAGVHTLIARANGGELPNSFPSTQTFPSTSLYPRS